MTKRKQPPIECRLRPNYTKKCIACYLTGLNRSLQAVGMALSRSLVFPALFLSLFALWLEDEHIFWAIPLAEALTLLLGIGLLVDGVPAGRPADRNHRIPYAGST